MMLFSIMFLSDGGDDFFVRSGEGISIKIIESDPLQFIG